VTENGAERNRDQAEPKLFDFQFAVSELGLADELGQARRGSRETDSGATDRISTAPARSPTGANMNADSPGDV
jgi:hypothetical protein